MHRRTFCLAAPLTALAGAVAAQSTQGRPVRILVGFSVGTTSDLLARLVAQHLSDRLGTPVIVENREGAGGTIAANLALRAPADGTTLLLGAGNLTLAPRLYRQVTFRPLEDFDPVGLIGFAPNVLVVNPAVPIHSIADLIAAARREPGRFRYASSGPGSGSWLGMEQLKAMTGIDLLEVPYSSTAQAATDAISGVVDLHFPSLAGGMSLIRNGRLRPLGITSAQRSPGAPDIPAIAETVPGYDASTWYGIVAPAGVPRETLQRLNGELQLVLRDPAVLAALSAVGVDPQPGSIAELRAAMAEAMRSGNSLMDRLNYRPQ